MTSPIHGYMSDESFSNIHDHLKLERLCLLLLQILIRDVRILQGVPECSEHDPIPEISVYIGEEVSASHGKSLLVQTDVRIVGKP